MNGQPENHDQVRQVASELREGTFLEHARKRSSRRKSAWNLLLPLVGFPMWGLLSAALVHAAWLLHVAFVANAASSERAFFAGPIGLGGLLVLIPCLMASVAPALFLTNFLVYLVPPARRAMDLEDRDVPGVGYSDSQRALLRIGTACCLFALPLVVIGALISTP
jgi:hypothetical protein